MKSNGRNGLELSEAHINGIFNHNFNLNQISSTLSRNSRSIGQIVDVVDDLISITDKQAAVEALVKLSKHPELAEELKELYWIEPNIQ